MQAILALLARPLLEAVVSAFGQVISDLLASWRAHDDAVARGRAEVERDAAKRVAEVIAAMGDVSDLSDDEILQRLREGKA